MKIIRKDYPKVRQYVKGSNTYYEVDLRKKNYQGPKKKSFSSRDKALEYARERGDIIELTGSIKSISVINGAPFLPDPRLRTWTEQCAVYGKTLEQAVEVALRVFETERAVKESPVMAHLLEEWIQDKTDNPLKKLRPKSEKTIRVMGNMFKQDFGGEIRIKEINKARIEDYLKDKGPSNQRRKNVRSYLSQFFNWTIQKEKHDKNPAENIELGNDEQEGDSRIAYFKVEQCQAIMREAIKKENEEMTAYFAICLFGGVRPEETERLKWENIKMDTKEIFIPASISKTKKERHFVMSDNLFEWMTFCKDIKPLVPTANIKNKRVKISKALGFPWIQDGLRHTFATYHYAKHKNLNNGFEGLRFVMGNSPKVIENFYKAAVAQAEIENFWGITPATVSKDA